LRDAGRSSRRRTGDGHETVRFEALNPDPAELPAMRRLIVNGDPGIRKGAVVDYDGEPVVCFSVTKNGEFHGPERVQLWCVVGEADEYEAFQTRDFVPMWLDVDAVDAEDVEVIRAKGDPAVAA